MAAQKYQKNLSKNDESREEEEDGEDEEEDEGSEERGAEDLVGLTPIRSEAALPRRICRKMVNLAKKKKKKMEKNMKARRSVGQKDWVDLLRSGAALANGSREIPEESVEK